MEQIEVVIIGAGVLGAAVANQLSQSGRSVLVLESHSRVAEGVTSRNSGVIHSGLYYPPKSLKAKFCIRGKELLYSWVQKKNIPYLKTGKIIVATNSDESESLQEIYQNARQSEATGIEMLDRQKKEDLFSNSIFEKATDILFASETGIVDPFELTRSFLTGAEEKGAMVLTNTKVLSVEESGIGWKLNTTRGEIQTELVVNAAGLYSDEIANLFGVSKYRIYPCRGDYFRFKSKLKIKTLVYPVKAKNASGLGIHLTLGLNGEMRLGPDTEYVNSKEDFSARPDKLEKFRLAAEKLFGPIVPEQLSYDQCGLRPKLRSPQEAVEKDFVVSRDLPNLVNLVGIESPGLTSSLAIAEYVEQLLK